MARSTQHFCRRTVESWDWTYHRVDTWHMATTPPRSAALGNLEHVLWCLVMSCDVLWIFMDLVANSTTSNSLLFPCSAGSLMVVVWGEVCALCVRKISATSIYFESLPYRVHPETGLIDFDELRCSVTKKYPGPIPVPIALPRIRGSQEKYVGLARMYYKVIKILYNL